MCVFFLFSPFLSDFGDDNLLCAPAYVFLIRPDSQQNNNATSGQLYHYVLKGGQ